MFSWQCFVQADHTEHPTFNQRPEQGIQNSLGKKKRKVEGKTHKLQRESMVIMRTELWIQGIKSKTCQKDSGMTFWQS